MNISENDPSAPSCVVDVWADNFGKEMQNLENRVKAGYTILSMDTEYPGVIVKQKYYDRTTTSVYSTMKANVDVLKPIQVGISLSDPEGNKPAGVCTWQFNFKFDCAVDPHEPKSIQLLEEARISFDKLAKNGIDSAVFMNVFKKGLLIANPNLTWLSFHGGYDFAYLIKLATGELLPETLKGFNELKKFIFPCLYDIKMLIQANDTLCNYSLSKLAKLFEVSMPGPLHQAGTDAYITAELFFRVKRSLLDHKVKKFENKLWGLSKLFSIESAEFEGKPAKKSLAERIKLIKLEREQEEMLYSEPHIVPQMVYGMYVVPAFYNYHYGMDSVQDFAYRQF